jgi:hypothetical protein
MSETNVPESAFNLEEAPAFERLHFFNPGVLESRLPTNVYESVLKNCLSEKTREAKGNNFNINSIKEIGVYQTNPDERVFEDFMGYMFDQWVEEYEIQLPKVPLMSGIIGAWVNYQKKGEFSPTHIHPDAVHFIVVVKVPQGEEETDPANYNKELPDFDMKNGSLEFIYNTTCDGVSNYTIPLTSDDEGKVFLFPGKMMHQIYPFTSTDGELITLCGLMSVFPVQQNQQV